MFKVNSKNGKKKMVASDEIMRPINFARVHVALFILSRHFVKDLTFFHTLSEHIDVCFKISFDIICSMMPKKT